MEQHFNKKYRATKLTNPKCPSPRNTVPGLIRMLIQIYLSKSNPLLTVHFQACTCACINVCVCLISYLSNTDRACHRREEGIKETISVSTCLCQYNNKIASRPVAPARCLSVSLSEPPLRSPSFHMLYLQSARRLENTLR